HRSRRPRCHLRMKSRATHLATGQCDAFALWGQLRAALPPWPGRPAARLGSIPRLPAAPPAFWRVAPAAFPPGPARPGTRVAIPDASRLSVTASVGTTISVRARRTEIPEFRRSGPLIERLGTRIDGP